MAKTIRVTVRFWKQASKEAPGKFLNREVDISTDASFLEMIDQVNNELIGEGQDQVSFEHDCREGICGTCNLVINGQPHGRDHGTTTCQLHMRSFKDGETIVVEPVRSESFPVIKDLVIDRSAFDRIMIAGGFVSTKVGAAPDANSIPIPKDKADLAMDAATCVGCGACVGACPNASAMLFVAAKVSQYALLPQGQAERSQRVLNMVNKMDEEGFGNCSNHYECEAACPKEISVSNIARLNREYLRASIASDKE